MINLEPETLKEIERILAAQVPDCEVWAFGSRINGRSSNFSDLDLALVCNEKIDRHRMEALKDALSASNIPIMVDVVDIAAVRDSFRIIITQNHEVFRKPIAF